MDLKKYISIQGIELIRLRIGSPCECCIEPPGSKTMELLYIIPYIVHFMYGLVYPCLWMCVSKEMLKILTFSIFYMR